MNTNPTTTFLTHLRIAVVATLVLTVLLCVVYPLIVWGAAQVLFPGRANGSLITKDGKVVGSQLIGQAFSDAKYFHPRPSAAGAGYDATSSGGSNLGPTSAKLINGTTKQPAPPATDAQAPATVAVPGTPAAAPTPAVPAAPPALVVDFDGIKLRVLHYCDDNGIPFVALRDGKEVDLASFKGADGWDEVKLITAFNDADHPLTVKAGRPIPADAVTASASGLDPHISLANALLQASRVAKARGLDEAALRPLITQATDGVDLGILGEPGINVLRLNLALDARR